MFSKLYKVICSIMVLSWSLSVTTLWAATAVNLRQQPLVFNNSFIESPANATNNFSITSSDVDSNNTSHVRFQQTYKNYPVWGADGVMHIQNGERITNANKNSLRAVGQNRVTYNGIIYQDLAKDLDGAPAIIFQPAQADKALTEYLQRFQKQSVVASPITKSKSSLVVYIDDAMKAHWAYQVTFKATPKTGMPAKPVYIVDAITLETYKQWDEVESLSEVEAGGNGGNLKVGKRSYDGIGTNLPKLLMARNSISRRCLIENDEVEVKDRRIGDAIVSFKCKDIDKTHNVYWNDASDEVNGGFSPSNDALYAGKMIKAMYQDWYHLSVLTDLDGSPLWLIMRVHDNMANAYWDGEQMTFGDGSNEFYPLVSLGVVAHEVSHGFTHQHAGLVGGGQSGGLNEAFSDMAAQALEFYINKQSSWAIGSEITKAPNAVMRYMDEPTQDCPKNHLPGVGCSISSMKQYYGKLDVHLSCGVFNKLFYLLATTPHWDVKKAFDVMVHANMHYWTYNTTFPEAGCGVINSALDLKYDNKAVDRAMTVVGLTPDICYQKPVKETPQPLPKPKPKPKPIPTPTPAPKPTPVPIPDDGDDGISKSLENTPWG